MKNLIVISSFNPLTYPVLKDIRLIAKKGHYHKVYLVSTGSDSNVHKANRCMASIYRHIFYKTDCKNITGDMIEEKQKWLDSYQEARYGNYLLVNSGSAKILNQSMVYYDEMLRHYLKEKRYHHTYSMCACALDIGQSNHMNCDLIKHACLCHDICKNMADDVLEKYTLLYDKTGTQYDKPVWHQFAGAYFVKHYLRIQNNKIVKAIATHTTGDSVAPLSKVVFIADKCDPGRGWDSSDDINLSKQSLRRGYVKVKQENNEFVQQELSKNG